MKPIYRRETGRPGGRRHILPGCGRKLVPHRRRQRL